MQRLFSTFPRGLPGAGLLLLRLVAGILSIDTGAKTLHHGPSTQTIPHLLAAGAGVLLLTGLWTPISGAVLALVELWIGLSQRGDPWVAILLGSLGLALALIGPGAWSLDARFFGRKRIDIRDRRR